MLCRMCYLYKGHWLRRRPHVSYTQRTTHTQTNACVGGTSSSAVVGWIRERGGGDESTQFHLFGLSIHGTTHTSVVLMPVAAAIIIHIKKVFAVCFSCVCRVCVFAMPCVCASYIRRSIFVACLFCVCLYTVACVYDCAEAYSRMAHTTHARLYAFITRYVYIGTYWNAVHVCVPLVFVYIYSVCVTAAFAWCCVFVFKLMRFLCRTWNCLSNVLLIYHMLSIYVCMYFGLCLNACS